MRSQFPDFDPVLIQLGPFAIRWYALAYIAGLLVGWLYARAIIRAQALGRAGADDAAKFDDFLLWVTLGIILGGRLGYVLFYKPGYFVANPLEILQLWEGGMSFHGGFLGASPPSCCSRCATQHPDPVAGRHDLAVGPIGLFLGRLANFINGELWGRATDVPWAMVFPRGGPLPRHPSQLYQALLEGIVLFVMLRC